MPQAEQSGYFDRITRDPDIMVGKPMVKGTRIPVGRVLQRLAETPNLDDLFQALPELTLEDVRACLAYAYEQLERREGRRARGRPFTRKDALFNIISIAGGDDKRPTDVSANKHKYLAEAYLHGTKNV